MAEEMKNRGRLTSLVGTVVRGGDKTAFVEVKTTKKHLLYNRSVKKRVLYVAHDSKNQCSVGDTAVIYQSKPVSKTKRWRIGKVVSGTEDGGTGG